MHRSITWTSVSKSSHLVLASLWRLVRHTADAAGYLLSITVLTFTALQNSITKLTKETWHDVQRNPLENKLKLEVLYSTQRLNIKNIFVQPYMKYRVRPRNRNARFEMEHSAKILSWFVSFSKSSNFAQDFWSSLNVLGYFVWKITFLLSLLYIGSTSFKKTKEKKVERLQLMMQEQEQQILENHGSCIRIINHAKKQLS